MHVYGGRGQGEGQVCQAVGRRREGERERETECLFIHPILSCPAQTLSLSLCAVGKNQTNA